MLMTYTGQFNDLLIIMQPEKNKFPEIRIKYAQFTLNGVTLDHCRCRCSRCKLWSMAFRRRHLGSPEVNQQFLLITHDCKELERRGRSIIVFASPWRIDWYATWATWVITWPWREVKSWPEISISPCICWRWWGYREPLPPSKLAPRHRSDKLKNAFESSSNIIMKAFR